MPSPWLAACCSARAPLLPRMGKCDRPSKGKFLGFRRTSLFGGPPASVDKSYDAVDANKLHRYVEELSAISDKYRDAGNQWWGRIPGMSSGTETQNWAKEKFKAIGVPTETVTIPDPQDLPKSWEVTVAANGKTIKLESSQSVHRFRPTSCLPRRVMRSWIRCGSVSGQPSDFIGKDVRGKAVFIYSIPTPSTWSNRHMWMPVGASAEGRRNSDPRRHRDSGQMQYVTHMEGRECGTSKFPSSPSETRMVIVEELNAMANGASVKTHVRWDVQTLPDLKEDIVVGKLAGMTDEEYRDACPHRRLLRCGHR